MDNPQINPWQVGGAPKPPSTPSANPQGSAPKPVWPSAPQVSTGPKVPEMPPKQTLQMRTMGSDVKSMERGDTMPIPESVMAPIAKKEIVFSPETENQFPPQSPKPPMNNMPIEEEPSHEGRKKAMVWTVSGVGIVALGLVGYFVIYPMLFPSAPPAPPTPPPAPPVVLIPHTSYFTSAPPLKGTINVSGDPSFALTVLQTLATTPPPTGIDFQEVEVTDSAGQMPFKNFFTAFGTSITADQLGTWFEDDFTAFAYYDTNGVWPGYIVKLKTGVTADAAKQGLAALETSDLTKLYLFPPGDVQGGGFKDGGVNGKSSRYVVFSTPGSAFSYTVIDSYVLFSTSYDGAKRAATLLGY